MNIKGGLEFSANVNDQAEVSIKSSICNTINDLIKVDYKDYTILLLKNDYTLELHSFKEFYEREKERENNRD